MSEGKIFLDVANNAEAKAKVVFDYYKKAAEKIIAEEDAVDAKNITIPYTSSHKVKYVYDEETKRYTRYSKGKKQTDEETGEDVTTKNIIISFRKNVTLNDGEDKGRQDLDNFGSQKGYYITNGSNERRSSNNRCRNSNRKRSRNSSTWLLNL